MLLNFKVSLATLLMFTLSACGGSSDSNDTTTKNPEKSSVLFSAMVKNPNLHTKNDFKLMVSKATEELYTGNKNSPKLDINSAQKTLQIFMPLKNMPFPNLQFDEIDFDLKNSDINFTYNCNYSGSVSYKGKVDSNGIGNIALTYNGCKDALNMQTNGNVVIFINEYSETSFNLDVFIDNLTWKESTTNYIATGLYSIISKADPTANNYSYSITYDLLHSANQNQTLTQYTNTYEYSDFTSESKFSYQGNITDSILGRVKISTKNTIGGYTQGTITISGLNNAIFEFFNGYVKYTEDTNNDGVQDSGIYINDISELFYSQPKNRTLVAIKDMSRPPYVTPPYAPHHDLYTTTPIEVTPGNYSDPDSPDSQITVSYRWYINGKVVEGQTSNILPARLAVFGDDVQVTMLVSDGPNLVESSFRNLILKDSPAEFITQNIPEKIKLGDTIQFSVQISDPDVNDDAIAFNMINSPKGATIDNEGLITWQVSGDYLFPLQSVDFNFTSPEENKTPLEEHILTLEVHTNKPLPITRSGIEIPKNDKSMWVGDYDSDGKNEVLSTDNNKRVFLLAEQNGSYSQKWLYPFSLPTTGNIVQVLSFDTDKDTFPEMIVVTENGVSIIDGTNSLATELFSTNQRISNAAIADINNDGVPELAYIYAQYAGDDSSKINVISFASPQTSLFTASINGAKQLVFANVDTDSAIELVTNNGLVYDTSSWANQWLSSTTFGDSSITIGDFNGDGINEIAGANHWGTIAIYSAANKSQLTAFDAFNTCTIQTANVDNDLADELLVGDCQWGQIHAYNLTQGKLIEFWSLSMEDHGSTSLTVGDSDNDGLNEVHWGTGASSSGADSFIVADLSTTSATTKPSETNIQLNTYSSAGWSSITEDKERAVFFIPKTASGYGGSRVLTMDTSGNYELSAELSSNWDKSKFSVTADYNNDGFGDIFLPTTQTYDGSFGVMQLFDSSMHYQTTGTYSSNIGIIKAYDVNKDSFIDATYVDNNTLKFIDINNQNIIASYTFDSPVLDFVINQTTTLDVLVARNDVLSLYSLNHSTFSEQSFIAQNCSRLALFNFDADAEKEVLCITSDNQNYNNNSQIIIYNIEDRKLIKVANHQYKGKTIIDVSIDESTNNEQNFFITAFTGDNNSYYDDNAKYTIEKHTAKGHMLWRSMPIVGRPTEHGLKVRHNTIKGTQMMLSTDKAMYLIN